MLSTKTLSFVAVFLSPLISAGLTPPTLNCGPNINAPNCLVYNAITIYVNQYAGTISANAFSKLQATLSGTPAASLNNVMSPLVAAFNSGALAASQQSLTVADQVQRVRDFTSKVTDSHFNFFSPISALILLLHRMAQRLDGNVNPT